MAQIYPLRLSVDFERPKERRFLKILWERRKCWLSAISPFPTIFSTLSKKKLYNLIHIEIVVCHAFNLDKDKILWFGKALQTT